MITPAAHNTCADVSSAKMSLTSSTLKRNPKMELNRSDLLRLLSILEGELQAREIVIAVLKAEQIKKLLYPNRCSLNTTLDCSATDGQSGCQYADPWNALSRDAFGAYDPSFNKSTTLALFNLKMTQLDALIVQQRRARTLLEQQLSVIESKYNQIVAELDSERQHCAHTSLTSAVDQRLESDVKTMSQSLENEKSREKQIVLCLLSERKQLIIKLIEERQRNEELLHVLSSEKAKIAEMVEGLEDESKRSLQMEAELEKYLTDFEGEREKFRNQLTASETRNAELAAEVDRLRQQLSGKAANSVNLGEGVRSAIVTMSSATRCVPTVPSVSSVSQPKASVAQHVISKSSPDPQHSYATIQSISSVKMNATIPPPPSTPAPPPKALVSNSKATPPVNAFQNITYNLETTPPSNTSKTTGAVRKLSASGAGRGTPPPIPPNKPLIKPVLPPQVQRSKDLNSTKVMTGSVGSAKTTTTPTNSLKSTTIGAGESTGEQNVDRLVDSNGADDNSVDLLCQELENFNSLLVSMVSTASHMNI